MMLDFIKGATAMGFLIVAGFFFRFWRESRDRLFALFASAFLLLAANGIILVAIHESEEHSVVPYLIRLCAFLIILVAIADKNFRKA